MLSAFVLVGQRYEFGSLDIFTLIIFLLAVGDHKIRPFFSKFVPGMPKHLTKTSVVMSYWNVTDMLCILFFFGGCICRALFIFNTPGSVSVPTLEYFETDEYKTIIGTPVGTNYYKNIYNDIETFEYSAPHNYLIDNAKFYFIFHPSE